VCPNASPERTSRLPDPTTTEATDYWTGARSWARENSHLFSFWKAIPSALAAIAQLYFGFGTVNQTLAVLGTLFGSYLLLWMLEYSWNLFVRAPAALDGERNKEIRALREEVRTLSDKPKRSPADEHHYGIAKAVLEKHGLEAIKILSHIKTHGEITFSDWFDARLPDGMDERAAKGLLEKLKLDHIVDGEPEPDRTGTKTVWRITPGMNKALDELLYQ
jgi:hypothetical protein